MNAKWDPTTLIFMAVMIVLILAYDSWTAWKRGMDTTITAQTRMLNAKFAGVAFLFGVLVDHLLFHAY